MKKWNWVAGVLFALLGLFIMIFPMFWLKVVVILLGLGSIAYGVYNLKFTKSVFENSSYEKTILIKSIVSIIIGILAVLLPATIAGAMWTIMIYILAVYLVISAVLGFYSVSLLKDSGIDRKRYVFENLGLLIGAVFLFIVPSKTLGSVIIKIIGFLIMIFGVVLIIIEFAGRKNVIKAEVVETTEDGKTKVEAAVKKLKSRTKQSNKKKNSVDAEVKTEEPVTDEKADSVTSDTASENTENTEKNE